MITRLLVHDAQIEADQVYHNGSAMQLLQAGK